MPLILRPFPVLILLLVNFAHAQTWQFTALPKAKIAVTPQLRKGNATQLGDGKINDHVYFPTLKNAMMDVTLNEPVALNQLALVRNGWDDWAIPARVSLQINDEPTLLFDINSARQKPMPTKQPIFEPLPFGKTITVKRIRLKILEVQTTANKHGTFELGILVGAPALIDLHEVGGVPLDADGLQVTLKLPQAIASIQCIAKAKRFRKFTHWATELGPLTLGEHTLTIPWALFGPEEHLQDPIEPLSISQFIFTDSNAQAPLPIELASWSFLKRDNLKLKPAWDRYKPLDFSADTDGWRPGIPMQGFGRFGWMRNNGLLVGTLGHNQFEVITRQRSGNKNAQATFMFHCGKADIQRWQTTQADWTGISEKTLFDYSDQMRNELAAKAPQLIRNRRKPQVIHASILAPGFLIDSQETTFKISLKKQAKSKVWLLAQCNGKTQWQPITKQLDLSNMTQGWMTLLWENQPKLPLLIVPAKRPQSITNHAGTIQLNFGEPLKRLAIGTPNGYRPWHEKMSDTHKTAQLAKHSFELAGILRAYPRRCQMRFKTMADHVQITERFGHMTWSNDWNELPTPIAPVAPLLSFAAMQNYPVTWQTDGITNRQIDTKYGPYRAAPGSVMQYTLPSPNPQGTFYLAPQNNDPMALHVAKQIASYNHNQAGKSWLQRDCLGSWWKWAPASQAFALLDQTQRKNFESNYRNELDKNIRPHTWHLRTEPHSGSSYPVSFGWIHASTGTLGDVNSGNGAALFGPYAYARISGDWQLLANRWPIFQGMMRYFLLSHDWNNMQTGAREFSGSSAIDMDGIGYEGAVAFWQMAKKLGHKNDAAIGQLLASRLAVSTTMRWLGTRWDDPQISLPTLAIGVGLGERGGFDIMKLQPHHNGPDHIHSELALSLAWVGQYPELFNLHRWGLGDAFWNHYQNQLIENILPDWRKNYPGNRNNHPANICTNLYMRGLLGATSQSMRDELAQQKNWGLTPGQQVATENAGLYSMILGMDCPIRLHDWDKAKITQATFNPKTKQARITIQSPIAMSLTWSLLQTPLSATCNGQAIKIIASQLPQQLQLPKGQSNLVIAY